ncbi:MAG: response regulator transcription factor [Candidatus Marinimicrobia bacterium]|nr:response regulator transcription factor [Candidatus Neomarinimicrobiota bacterium]
MVISKESKRRVLVVEDDESIIDLLTIHLEDMGFEVVSEDHGELGLGVAQNEAFDLIILDIMLPGMDGMEICKRIRMEDRLTPIMMLTSRSEELDKVLGLELGADEYITKPFSIREFIARVKAIFRRMEVDAESSTPKDTPTSIKIEVLDIDSEKRRVTVNGQSIVLTAKEFDLLYLFASHPGKAYSRQQLLDLIWGYQFSGYEHTVNSHINRLRAKIEEDPANPRYIQTVWSVGYRFVDLDELTI